MNALLESFITEARENLEVASEAILTLESSPEDASTLDELFRSVHTIKGASGMFEEMVALHQLVHVAEDGLDRLREGEFQLSADYTDLLFAVLDQLNAWLDHLEQHEALPDDADQAGKTLIDRLAAWQPGGDTPEHDADDTPTAPAAVPSWVMAMPQALREEAIQRTKEQVKDSADAHSLLAICYTPDESAFYSGHDPLTTLGSLPGLVGFRLDPREPWPPFEALDPYRCLLVFQALAVASLDDIAHHLRYVAQECEWQALPLAALTPGNDSAALEEAFDRVAERATNGDENAASSPDHAGAAAHQAASDPNSASATLAQQLFAEQLRVLETPAVATARSGRLRAVAQLARQVLSQQRQPTTEGTLASLAQAERESVDQDAEAPLMEWLNAQLDGDSPQPSLDVTAPQTASPSAAAQPHKPQSPQYSPERAQQSNIDKNIDKNSAAQNGSAQNAAKTQVDSKPLRVEQYRIDELMTLAGELIVAKNALPFLAKRLESGDSRDALVRELKLNYANIERIADSMQAAVMSARMVPVSTIFQRFPRLVRDIARKLDKQVELVTEGEDTEADKNIIGGLADPLTHLVRNSLDHGMEPPAEREAAGKPATGKIILRAKTLDDHVMIEVSDDGGGIDPDSVMRKAYQKGLIDEHSMDDMSHDEALQLILLPGFSTADQVSDISGRGVGMDAVKSAIRGVGGNLLIKSEPGQGTTMRILLPMSMAVARVLLVEVAGQCYGVPMSMIRETVRLPAKAFNHVKQSEMIMLRDELIPVHRSRALLGLDAPASPPDEEAVLVLDVDNQHVGVVVDEFRQGIDIVQKPMEGIMAQFDIYAGSALTGDGQVLLVLNIPSLLRRALG